MTYVLVWVLPGGAVLARYMLRPVSVCYKSEFTKTAKHRIMQTTPHDSPGTPVFWCQKSPRNSTICKAAPCSRQITMPAPHRSVFYRPDALPATQPTVSKHWRRALKETLSSYLSQWPGLILSLYYWTGWLSEPPTPVSQILYYALYRTVWLFKIFFMRFFRSCRKSGICKTLYCTDCSC